MRTVNTMASPSVNDGCPMCGAVEDLQLCGHCLDVAYCGREHQVAHWRSTHKKYCKYIPGTKVERSKDLGPNPLDPSISFPAERNGKTVDSPLALIAHFKLNKDGTTKMRLLVPGKLTPYIMNATIAEQRHREFKECEHVETPYEEEGNKQVLLPSVTSNLKYRHIGAFKLEELRKMGWDGAMYNSTTLEGEWAPFVCGYDSDPEYEYEVVDVAAAKASRVVGLPADLDGSYGDAIMSGVGHIKNKRS
jgi:hypothetical protein